MWEKENFGYENNWIIYFQVRKSLMSGLAWTSYEAAVFNKQKKSWPLVFFFILRFFLSHDFFVREYHVENGAVNMHKHMMSTRIFLPMSLTMISIYKLVHF